MDTNVLVVGAGPVGPEVAAPGNCATESLPGRSPD
jgi:hypothetical protein